MAGITAVQIAIIAKQVPPTKPSFAEGGIVTPTTGAQNRIGNAK
jgi:hypothetical protein